jgi:hypothetical protein
MLKKLTWTEWKGKLFVVEREDSDQTRDDDCAEEKKKKKKKEKKSQTVGQPEH